MKGDEKRDTIAATYSEDYSWEHRRNLRLHFQNIVFHSNYYDATASRKMRISQNDDIRRLRMSRCGRRVLRRRSRKAEALREVFFFKDNQN